MYIYPCRCTQDEEQYIGFCPVHNRPQIQQDLKPLGQKAPLALLPAAPLRAVAGAMEHGIAKGRSAWNWQTRENMEQYRREYLSAALRHIGSTVDPMESDIDEESGIHHLALACASLMILMWKLEVDYTPSKFLDRPGAIKEWSGKKEDLPPTEERCPVWDLKKSECEGCKPPSERR